MELHVILGPPGSGKAGRALTRLREDAAAGRDAFLVVPGAIDRARFLRELAGSGQRVVLGVEVGTFDQLVARVAGSPPVRRTDRTMERIVVRDALRGEGGELGRLSQWAGFVDTARQHLDRIRRARVWGSESLNQALGELPGGATEEWLSLEQAVERLLSERRLRDDAWFEQRAVDAIRADRCGVGSVVVYGFEALPDHRVELLERIARRVPVTVSLEWRPGHLVHERVSQLRDRWRNRGAFIEELDGLPDAHPTLAWLSDQLFEPVPTRPPVAREDAAVPTPVAFIECCGPLQEAEEVVREVALLGARGFAWDDIVVASASIGPGTQQLEAAFQRAGIPARVQSARRAIDVPAGRAVHDLLESLCHADAIGLIGALRVPIFDVDADRLDVVELRVRARRELPGSQLEDPELLDALPPEVAALVQHVRIGDGDALALVRELLASLAPRDLGELELLHGVASGIEGLATAAGGADGIQLSDVRDAVARLPLARPDRSDSGVVVIAAIEDLRSVTYPAVVLRGLHLAGFRPRVEADEDLPTAARDLLHLVVSRTRSTIRAVRQSSTAAGGDLAPSPAWLELRRLVPDAPLRTRRLGDVAVAPDEVRLASESCVSVALAHERGLDVSSVPDAISAQLAGAVRIARSEHVSDPLRSELAALDRFAATALETYATCSAKWFIDKRLRATDPDDDRSRLVEGNLAHELLAVLVSSSRELDIDALTHEATALAQRIRPKVDRHGLLDHARVDRVVRNVVATLAAEIELGWEAPDAVHVERALDSQDPSALAPGLLLDGVEVVGRVDRVDIYGSRAVLHDYKYRASEAKWKHLVADRQLQLLIYWLALQRPGSPIEPVGALYRAVVASGAASGIADPSLRELGVIPENRSAGVLDEAAREGILQAARAVVTDAVTSLRAGVVRPLDDPARCPSHCRLQTICRIGEGVAT